MQSTWSDNTEGPTLWQAASVRYLLTGCGGRLRLRSSFCAKSRQALRFRRECSDCHLAMKKG